MNHIYTQAVLFYDLISAPNLAKMPLAFCGIRLLIYVLRQCRHIILLLTRQMSSTMGLQWKWAHLNDAQQGCMCHESLISRCCCNRPTIFTRRRHCPSLKFTLQSADRPSPSAALAVPVHTQHTVRWSEGKEEGDRERAA